jgi:hypothetical protein
MIIKLTTSKEHHQMSSPDEPKTNLWPTKSYYDANKDASNTYTEGKIACRTGKSLEENPYKDIMSPFHITWKQGFIDEITLFEDLKKIVTKYYLGEDGE